MVGFAPPVDDACLFRAIDAMEEVAAEIGKTLPQIAINWLLQRPTVASVPVGARDEAQLKQEPGRAVLAAGRFTEWRVWTRPAR